MVVVGRFFWSKIETACSGYAYIYVIPPKLIIMIIIIGYLFLCSEN